MCVVFAARTEGAPVLVLQLPPPQTGLGWRLLFQPALAGDPGGALGAEVCGDVPGQPPLGRKRSVATSHHTLRRRKHKQTNKTSVDQREPGAAAAVAPAPGVTTLKGLSPLWVSMCLCSQL